MSLPCNEQELTVWLLNPAVHETPEVEEWMQIYAVEFASSITIIPLPISRPFFATHWKILLGGHTVGVCGKQSVNSLLVQSNARGTLEDIYMHGINKDTK